MFFKLLSVVSPVVQTHDKLFRNVETGIALEYQKTANIGWTSRKYDESELEIGSTNVIRRPDITIAKNGRDILIVDAKCTEYSDVDDEKQEKGPERNIANQMIIYLDYVTSARFAIVLFADKKIRGDVSLDDDNRRILFLNCYPYATSSLALEVIRKYIGSL